MVGPEFVYFQNKNHLDGIKWITQWNANYIRKWIEILHAYDKKLTNYI